MKKILILLIFIIIITGCSKNNKNNEKLNSNTNISDTSNIKNENNVTDENEKTGKYIVNLYLFHSNSCSHCQDEKAWLKRIESDYKYLKIHYYEVSEYEELYEKVRTAFKIDSTGVPLTIIGDDYYLGFSETKERKFIRKIESVSENEYCDIVAAILENRDYSSCVK